jgi:LmbE family N-acetylglucosaminyl deacetylase
VLCFTHGEASTLHTRPGELAQVRASELRAAATILGVDRVELLAYPDGRLTDTSVDELAAHAERMIAAVGPSHLLVFDDTGITGHPDHLRATAATVQAARAAGLPVLAWTIPDHVARELNGRHGTAFTGRPPQEIDVQLSVSRTRQRRAIAAHASQSAHNLVLQHRLRLLADAEYLRVLYRPAPPDPAGRSTDKGTTGTSPGTFVPRSHRSTTIPLGV